MRRFLKVRPRCSRRLLRSLCRAGKRGRFGPSAVTPISRCLGEPRVDTFGLLVQRFVHCAMNLFNAFSFFSAVLGVAFAVTGEAASAPSVEREKPMRVMVVHNDAPGCEPNCDEWISAEGEMVAGTPAEFRRALKSVGSRKPPVFISSGGGSVDAAIEIGRLVRARRLDVAVSKTEFSESRSATVEPRPSDETRAPARASGKPARAAPKPARGRPRSYQAYCASACTLVLAAGKRRFVSPAAHVGVHESSFRSRR